MGELKEGTHLTRRQVWTSILIATVLPSLGMNVEGQDTAGSLWTISSERVRIVFPTEESVDPEKARRLIEILEAQGSIAGLPPGTAADKRITVSLAAELPGGIQATSSAADRLIILPLDAALQWEPARLRRVTRHEMAHIGLGVFLDHAAVPVWFQEGFAEWAVGGLTCEGEVRIRLDLLTRRRKAEPTPRPFGSGGLDRSRLSYDYFATVFEYLEIRGKGVVADGRLLKAVKANGVTAGIAQLFGADFEELAEGWQVYLLGRYNGLPNAFACAPTPPVPPVRSGDVLS